MSSDFNEARKALCFMFFFFLSEDKCVCAATCGQGWKLKPKPENPVLKEILETQTETDTYLAKILKT